MSGSNFIGLPVRNAPGNLMPNWMNRHRTRVLTQVETPKPKPKQQNNGCVLYWMQRDMRASDNWALLFAGHLAEKENVPLRVCYPLPPPPSNPRSPSSPSLRSPTKLPPRAEDMYMTERQAQFLLGGLEDVETQLTTKNVPFHILQPASSETVGQNVQSVANKYSAVAVVCDFHPLRKFRVWTENQAAGLLDSMGVPLYQVDAHNIVPCWHVSPKREVGARTLRPKINNMLAEFLTAYPPFQGNAHIPPKNRPQIPQISWKKSESYLSPDHAVGAVDWATPGRAAGMDQFKHFCEHGLKKFGIARNNPNQRDVCSQLSPWLNFGHVSFQTIAREAGRKSFPLSKNMDAFLEEGIIRRELSDNYVFYTPDSYDSLDGAAEWARNSLEEHERDQREFIYSLYEFEQAKTHDDLWNAAQLQMIREGKMHGFLRMYWAKKILEWTPNASIALRTGLYLNDRYSLDGNDPNGFVGVGWSVMGVHDMGWTERNIFGKIRFMNYKGCQRKFDVEEFVQRYPPARNNALQAVKDDTKSHTAAIKRKRDKEELQAADQLEEEEEEEERTSFSMSSLLLSAPFLSAPEIPLPAICLFTLSSLSALYYYKSSSASSSSSSSSSSSCSSSSSDCNSPSSPSPSSPSLPSENSPPSSPING